MLISILVKTSERLACCKFSRAVRKPYSQKPRSYVVMLEQAGFFIVQKEPHRIRAHGDRGIPVRRLHVPKAVGELGHDFIAIRQVALYPLDFE